MSEKSAAEGNIEISQRLQERFETYWLGLIFTLLALSVQSAKFGVSVPADVLELLSWLLLLVAGLAGMSRFEWMPRQYAWYAHQINEEEKVRAAQQRIADGIEIVNLAPLMTEMPAAQYLAKAEATVKEVEDRLKQLDAKQLRKYRLKRWSFALALGSLIAARGYVPVEHIVRVLSGQSVAPGPGAQQKKD